jgi:iron complex outermembrane receptor protein
MDRSQCAGGSAEVVRAACPGLLGTTGETTVRADDRLDIRGSRIEPSTPSPRTHHVSSRNLQWHSLFGCRVASLFAIGCLLLLFATPGPVRAQSAGGASAADEGSPATDDAEDTYEYADDDDYDYAEDEAYEEETIAPETAGPEPDYSGVEEIVVKGSATQIIDADAAESAVQFDAQELDDLGATDISDIARVTPNLEITQAGATSANFFIRGVGLADFSANSASAVSVYQDNVPLNASALQLTGLFDLQSLAVLRGPQGTGSARNASAGAIKLESRKPTSEYQAELKTTLGSYWSDDAYSALIQRYNGALQMPIVDDILSTRLSFMIQKADPFQTNGCGVGQLPQPNQPSKCGVFQGGQIDPIPDGLPARVGEENRWALRGLFRFEPATLDMDWLLSIYGSRLDEQSTLGQAMGTGGPDPTVRALGGTTQKNYGEPDQIAEFRDLNRFFRGAGFSFQQARTAATTVLGNNLAFGRPLDRDPYRGDYNRVGQTVRDTWGASLNGEMFFDDVPFLGPVELQTVTGYAGYFRSRDQDLDFTPQILFEWAPAEDEAWQLFQELKAKGESDTGALRWEVGGYFLMEELDASINQKTLVSSFDFLRLYNQSTRSFAFYGGFGWDFLEDFTLDMGIRYNWERKSFDFTQITGVVDVATPQESTWTAPTGLISLTYRFTEEVSAYWKYTRGWKGGHYNANEADTPPARPETVDSVETGFNGSWLDARIRLAGALFYYKYKDYQLFLFENTVAAPPILQIINANDAEQYGAELELQAVPLQDWAAIPEFWGDLSATVRFGWLESQFLDFVNQIERTDSQTFQRFQQTINYTGNRLPSSPEFKVSAALEYPLSFGRYGTIKPIKPRYDFDWSDDIYFDPSNGRGVPNPNGGQLPPLTIGQAAFIQHHLRLAWTNEEGNLTIAGWVRNLTDVRYKTSAFDASVFGAVVLNFVGEPRTGGFDVILSF